MISIVMDQDNIRRIWETYQISNEIGLEVPSLVGRVTLAKGNWVALYKEALKASLRLPILNIMAE